ncbi:uncharacterized protein DDB_G0283697-like [Macrobrachium nipponense]|uniref:uncharacterized protein DDB_G0283697-like n=1 Tax=Macrobrachium nipponense TaxID=159736 RepID=UPI0030C7E8DE
MGLIIEKQRSEEGEDQDDADKEEQDDDDRDAKKDGRKKRRKKEKSRETAKSDEGGTPVEVQAEYEDPKGRKSQRGKSKLLKDYWKTCPREGGSSLPKGERHPTEERGEDARTQRGTDAASDLDGKRNSKKIVEKEAKNSEKSKNCNKCGISCCLKVNEDSDDIRDEKGADKGEEKEMVVETLSPDESHSSDNEAHLGDGSTMETETKSNEDQNHRRHPAIKGSRRIPEFPGGSPFSIRRYHEKKSRYLSSRPTSLETIIEDVTPSPFFFQDSIIQYSDGREDHRGIRERANLFQVRPEEESDDRKGEVGYFEKNDFGRWEDSSEEDIQEEDMNTLPLRSSRIFRGVIENLNYIFDNDGGGDDTFSADATNFLFQELYEECTLGKRGSFSSSSSSKCDYGTEERLRDISEKEEEEEEEEDACSADNGGASKRSHSGPAAAHLQSLTEAFIQNHPFQNQLQGKKDIEYPVSLPEINQRHRNSFSSSEESKGNLSLSEPGCERPQVAMAEEWGSGGGGGGGRKPEEILFPKGHVWRK